MTVSDLLSLRKGLAMVGGIVIEVSESRTRPELVFVDVKERQAKLTCGVYLEKNSASLQIQIGDSLWWQGRNAFWTSQAPKGAHRSADDVMNDVRIPRIGYSGVGHPDFS